MNSAVFYDKALQYHGLSKINFCILSRAIPNPYKEIFIICHVAFHKHTCIINKWNISNNPRLELQHFPMECKN